MYFVEVYFYKVLHEFRLVYFLRWSMTQQEKKTEGICIQRLQLSFILQFDSKVQNLCSRQSEVLHPPATFGQ